MVRPIKHHGRVHRLVPYVEYRGIDVQGVSVLLLAISLVDMPKYVYAWLYRADAVQQVAAPYRSRVAQYLVQYAIRRAVGN